MPKETIQLSDHFTYSRLLRFVLPCIGTMPVSYTHLTLPTTERV